MDSDLSEVFTLALFIIGVFGGSLELALVAVAGWFIVSYLKEHNNQ